MRLLILGAGAVGGYLGGCLLRQGHEVVLLVRPEAAAEIEVAGFSIVSPGGSFQVQPSVVTGVEQAFSGGQRYDAILLATKSYDLEPALDQLLAVRPEPPLLITLQNGIGLEELVMQRVTPERLVAGSLTTPLRKDRPGQIVVEREDRGLALAPVVAGQDISQWVKLFADAGVPTQGVADYRAMKWSKALLNMIGNASAAILDRHPGEIYRERATFDLEVDMLRETLVVMRRLRLPVLDLPGAPAGRLALGLRYAPRFVLQRVLTRLVAGGRGQKMPSFYLDLRAGRRQNEVRYHNVAVAQKAAELGVAARVNAALGATLMAIAGGDVEWAEYRGKPARLLAEVDSYRGRKS
jgi:2-dehydropantoate 2-reductase